MPVSATVGISERPIGLDTQSLSGDSGTEHSLIEINEEKRISGNNHYALGRIIKRKKVEKKKVEIDKQSGVTEKSHILLSDTHGELSLVKERYNSTNDGNYKISTITETEPEINSFAIVDEQIVLIFDSSSNSESAIKSIESAFNTEIEVVNFDIKEVLRKLDEEDALEGTLHSTLEDVSEDISRASISGDLNDSEFMRNIDRSSEVTWSIFEVFHEKKSIKIGIASRGNIVLYGSVNLPQTIIAELILDYSLLDC